ncbi:MAG TPA: DUF2625 domain-containing protein [Candidatus Saccharimonadales bacterium]|jgi:hypothetical protein|nr:DUF2625 domain-containing protein [Candidatus Saccharimonadales bacterium]
MPKRALTELLEIHQPAWPTVNRWIQAAENDIEVLLPDDRLRGSELEEAQVTTRSPLGAVVYETGGLLVDRGWLRLLGSGHPKLPRSMAAWNRGRSTTPQGESLGFCLIADDVIGGFFALNGGAFPGHNGEVFYFAPDSLRWESMKGIGYSDFLVWSFSLNLASFYQSFRWSGWETEVSALSGDQAFSIYPPLWSAEGKSIDKCSRKPSPVAEVFGLNVLEFPKQVQPRLE